MAKKKSAKKPATIYQFKLTLLGIQPKIWRRIQIPDCKLHNLHLHIQAAMGWDNKHLHHFDIKGERHGIPEHLDYDGDGSIIDSKKIKVSDIVPKDGKNLAFRYTYDFGDNWEHEVLFEGIVEARSRRPNTPSALKANEPAHQKTAVASAATNTF
jgi:hypothetical protein